MQKVPPPSDDFPEVLDAVIEALVDGEMDKAERALAPIGFEAHVKEARPSLSKTTQAQIFVRDGFKCRYCGGAGDSYTGDAYPELHIYRAVSVPPELEI